MTRGAARTLVLRRLKQYCPAAPDIVPDTMPISELTDRMGIIRTYFFCSGFFTQPIIHSIGEVVQMLETRNVTTVGDLIMLVAEIETFLAGIPNLED